MLTSLARHGKISVPFNVLKQKKINGQDRLPACEADVFLRPATGFVNFKPSALCQSHLQQEKKKKKIDYHTRLVKVNALPPNANSRVRARVANRGRLIRLHARPVPGQSGILFAVRFRIIGQSMRPPPPPSPPRPERRNLVAPTQRLPYLRNVISQLPKNAETRRNPPELPLMENSQISSNSSK